MQESTEDLLAQARASADAASAASAAGAGGVPSGTDQTGPAPSGDSDPSTSTSTASSGRVTAGAATSPPPQPVARTAAGNGIVDDFTPWEHLVNASRQQEADRRAQLEQEAERLRRLEQGLLDQASIVQRHRLIKEGELQTATEVVAAVHAQSRQQVANSIVLMAMQMAEDHGRELDSDPLVDFVKDQLGVTEEEAIQLVNKAFQEVV